MKAAIIAGGDYLIIPPKHDWDLIICADSGLEHALRLGIEPHYVIGDYDSASPDSLAIAKEKGIKILKFPVDKDKTDTQLAVEKAVKEGATYIEILGGIGSRFDHSLANAQLLQYLSKYNIDGHITDGSQYIYLLKDKLTLTPDPNMQFSILPLTLTVEGLNIKKAKYELNNYTIKMGDTRTLSNEFTTTHCHISIKKGLAIVIVFDSTEE